MNQKTIIVTGANSGIGYQTALGLAQQGHTVIMMCRNPQRGADAQQRIITETGNQRVELIVVDLASQQSIRDGVATFLSRHKRLDVLINNAANFDITMKEPVMTEDGVETIFATNHLGVFLMTNLLLPILQESRPARILNVASKGLITQPFLKIEFDNLNGEKKFGATHAYYHSKLAQVMFTYDLAKRLQATGVTVNCIRVPAVRLDDGRYDNVPAFLQAIYRFKMKFSLSAEEMADCYIRLATAPEFETITGTYFDENCQPVKSSGASYKEQVWQQLWDASMKLTAIENLTPVR